MTCALAPWPIIASTRADECPPAKQPKLDHRPDLTDLHQGEGEQGHEGSGRRRRWKGSTTPETFP
jgi:hypothetical protein